MRQDWEWKRNKWLDKKSVKGYRNWNGLARQYLGKEAEPPWVRKPVAGWPRDQFSKEIRQAEQWFRYWEGITLLGKKGRLDVCCKTGGWHSEILSKTERRDLELIDWRRKRLKEGNLNLMRKCKMELAGPGACGTWASNLWWRRDGGKMVEEPFDREFKRSS